MNHDKIKSSINGIRSIENNERCYISEKKLILHTDGQSLGRL